MLAAGQLRAQQANLQALVPPAADLSRPKTADISGGYLRAHGGGAFYDGLDVTATFGERLSSSTYRTVTTGAAMLGLAGEGKIRVPGGKKDLVGLSLHLSGNKYYFGGGVESPRWSLLASIPLSINSYTFGEKKEEVSVYSFIAGFQGGAAWNLRAGDFVVSPSALLSVLTGYREKYKGGVYWSNLDSGVMKPFCALTLGADLLWRPKRLRLGASYQRTQAAGRDNKALDSFLVQLSYGGRQRDGK